jgi:glycosyltransferase involved in cell wall biosynthesis
MRALSVIMPAWRAEDYLADALDSLSKQTAFRSGAVACEVMLGVDGCDFTRQRALELAGAFPRLNLKICWFPENHGPYLVRNSLCGAARYNWLLFFDADDTADPEMVALAAGYARPVMVMIQQYPGGRMKRTWGQVFISREVWSVVGGFFSWRCAADKEMLLRARRLGYPEFLIQDRVLVHRRAHARQLTRAPQTGFGSPLRNEYKSLMKAIEKLKIGHIDPETAVYETLLESQP